MVSTKELKLGQFIWARWKVRMVQGNHDTPCVGSEGPYVVVSRGSAQVEIRHVDDCISWPQLLSSSINLGDSDDFGEIEVCSEHEVLEYFKHAHLTPEQKLYNVKKNIQPAPPFPDMMGDATPPYRRAKPY